MAPLANVLNLVRRQDFDDDDDDIRCNSSGYCYSYSRWDDWGRWVALAVIVIVVLIVAFGFSCLNNRRRRRRGAPPMYGTGWMGAKPQAGQYGNNQNYYGQPQQHYGAPAPPYSAAPMGHQQTGNTFNSNEGYYGQHGGAYEMQPPQNAYHPQRGGEPVYDAPDGPPPKKGDGIIR